MGQGGGGKIGEGVVKHSQGGGEGEGNNGKDERKVREKKERK